MPSDVSIFISKKLAPVKKLYRAYRNEVIFRRHLRERGLKAVRLTEDQKEQRRALFEKNGLSNDFIGYRTYCARYGAADPRLISESHFWDEILPRLNNKKLSCAWADKNYLEPRIQSGGVLMPQTLIRNVNGFYYDGNFRLLSRSDALALLESEQKFMAKGSLAAEASFKARVYEGHRAAEFMDRYSKNYIVQRVIKQHADFERINPVVVCTVRVMTFCFRGGCHILHAVLRCGGEHVVVDTDDRYNCTYAINGDGVLMPGPRDGFGDPILDGRAERVKREVLRVPCFQEIAEAAKRLHAFFPYFGIVAWDFTVDSDNNVILIEANINAPNIRTFQLLYGPLFGGMSEEALHYIGGLPVL